MKNKIIILFILSVFGILLLIYPHIELKKDNYIYMFSYGKDLIDSEDFQKLEDELCYDESYAYNKKRNITLKKYEYKNFLFFKYLKAKYVEGNLCETEYILEQSYIQDFIENAIILENKDNVNIEELIRNKTPIIKNKRYSLSEDYKYIEYNLNKKNMSMYIYESDDKLLVIQVNINDETKKFIAYK